MLIIEYDHRSIKALPSTQEDFKEMLKVVDLIKKNVPSEVRVYNPFNKVWFISEGYIKLVRQLTSNLDVSWEKRI